MWGALTVLLTGALRGAFTEGWVRRVAGAAARRRLLVLLPPPAKAAVAALQAAAGLMPWLVALATCRELRELVMAASMVGAITLAAEVAVWCGCL